MLKEQLGKQVECWSCVQGGLSTKEGNHGAIAQGHWRDQTGILSVFSFKRGIYFNQRLFISGSQIDYWDERVSYEEWLTRLTYACWSWEKCEIARLKHEIPAGGFTPRCSKCVFPQGKSRTKVERFRIKGCPFKTDEVKLLLPESCQSLNLSTTKSGESFWIYSRLR